jgi:radical SAM protein with 4Fe4S-binding SPASM domain
MDSVWKLANKNGYQINSIENSSISALIKITSSCRSRCQYCLSWQTKQEDLPTNEFINIANDIQKFKNHRIALSGGEPTTHPEFYQIIKKCHEIGTYLTVITDGQYTSNSQWVSMADEITFSIDSCFSDIYLDIRGINGLQRSFKNISNAAEKGVKVSINIVLSHQSIASLEQSIEILVGMGVSAIYFLELETHLSIGEKLLPTANDLSDLFQNILPKLRRKYPRIIPENTFLFSNKSKYRNGHNSCIIPWMHMTIRPNGDVYPCCRIGDDTPREGNKDFCLGNIKEASICDLWRSSKRIKIQTVITESPPLPCLKCSIGNLFNNKEEIWSQIESIRM